MNQPYKQPAFEAKAFNCPHCHAYSNQKWARLANLIPSNSEFWQWGTLLYVALCAHCNKGALWVEEDLVWPVSDNAPSAAADMPTNIAKDYEEARKVLSVSPRSAAALLRLCVQKLCIELGEGGENINKDIGSLVAKGSPQWCNKPWILSE